MGMTSCGASIDDPFRCRTKWDLFRQVLGLLPRGRAWQSHVAIFEAVRPDPLQNSGADAYEAGVSALGAAFDERLLTRQQQYWAAFAEVLEHLHQRACALIEEFFCATSSETRGEWGIEYGFPDTCEPYDTLCQKVVATGGCTCAYLASLAARVGYVIECRDGSVFGASADCLVADCTPLCETVPGTIHIRIITALSPAASAPTVFAADAIVADCTPVCPVLPDTVVCLIERFKPAHIRAIYEVI